MPDDYHINTAAAASIILLLARLTCKSAHCLGLIKVLTEVEVSVVVVVVCRWVMK